MNRLISQATQRNWQRLNVNGTSGDGRLRERANKKLSERFILPLEHIVHRKNVEFFDGLAKKISQSHAPLADVMFSLTLNLLTQKEMLSSSRTNVAAFLDEYSTLSRIAELQVCPLPLDEPNLLGTVYLSLCTEGVRNTRGMYYTPLSTVRKLLSDLDFRHGQTLLDPCCGSGDFLINTSAVTPASLVGSDIDPIAVMLAKANLMMRYPDHDFCPQIYQADFLTDNTASPWEGTFDYIVTNPPWGATSDEARRAFPEIASGETFSCFLLKSLGLLKQDGTLKYLLPQAFLNVRTHRDIRALLLENFSVDEIELFPALFSGVTTQYLSLTASHHAHKKTTVVVRGADNCTAVDTETFRHSPYNIFCLLSETDRQILDTVSKHGVCSMANSNSLWGLGIVTGDNKGKLFETPAMDREAIYTGKEIAPYVLRPNKKFIHYDRTQFQQVAKDEIYRAPEKLVYKFVSTKLVFAFDDAGRLFLNSANILIPRLPGISIKSMLMFLNSELYRFIYSKEFSDIKILRGNLEQLPFPRLSAQNDLVLSAFADRILAGDFEVHAEAQSFIYHLFALTKPQVAHIKNVLKP